ncbi:hypothetical protein [Paraflavitalea sp. CAU 1676]|uniref:hypothetical protein n=1 Tax=Paraflavitalea sp. CAU 1676 TaxID=3032598 RepID=UPI0023DA1A29|nr:hypothetical protein [Paraflavitalea sp. CAU 1676]MDF2189134.1 hypothetical protein [Paraflavitalea sp. CAU 1676]
MMHKILIVFTFFAIGCSTTSRLTTNNPIAERNKDIIILSTLIHDYLSLTNGRDFGLNELCQADTLKRISKNFEMIELKSKGGHISVYYRFSQSREIDKVELTDNEKALLLRNNWTEKQFNKQYDGEIQFDYGERFYRIKRFIIKSE